MLCGVVGQHLYITKTYKHLHVAEDYTNYRLSVGATLLVKLFKPCLAYIAVIYAIRLRLHNKVIFFHVIDIHTRNSKL